MRITHVAVGAAALAWLAVACAPKILVPPRMALRPYEVVGVVEFTTTSEGQLAEYATRRFIEEMRRDQATVRVLDLGTEQAALAAVDRTRLDRDTFRVLGDEYDAPTILCGTLDVSGVRPAVSIFGLAYATVAADVDATLSARLVETATGASIWSGSATASQRVGGVSVIAGRRFVFDARDPARAYGALVEVLVHQLARDFQVTWVHRKG